MVGKEMSCDIEQDGYRHLPTLLTIACCLSRTVSTPNMHGT
jgi:hypothetical protein